MYCARGHTGHCRTQDTARPALERGQGELDLSGENFLLDWWRGDKPQKLMRIVGIGRWVWKSVSFWLNYVGVTPPPPKTPQAGPGHGSPERAGGGGSGKWAQTPHTKEHSFHTLFLLFLSKSMSNFEHSPEVVCSQMMA